MLQTEQSCAAILHTDRSLHHYNKAVSHSIDLQPQAYKIDNTKSIALLLHVPGSATLLSSQKYPQQRSC